MNGGAWAASSSRAALASSRMAPRPRALAGVSQVAVGRTRAAGSEGADTASPGRGIETRPHVPLKDPAEMERDRAAEVYQIDLPPQQPFGRGNAPLTESTGVDQTEVAQVRLQIHREAVHRDAAADRHPDRRDLATGGP